MIRRRVALAAGIVAAIGLGPAAVLAEKSLQELLLPPYGAQWTERAPDPLDVNGVVSEYVTDAQSDARSELHDDGFVRGLDRSWDTGADNSVELDEQVLAFGDASGATSWAGGSGDISGDSNLRHTYTTGIPGCFMGYFHDPGGDDSVEAVFSKGANFFDITLYGGGGKPDSNIVLAQSREIYGAAPGAPPPESVPVAAFVTVGAGGALVLLVGSVLFVAVRVSRRRGGRGFVSPDGLWWWDGNKWQPTTLSPPASPSPAARSPRRPEPQGRPASGR